jgi:hypothetical protein
MKLPDEIAARYIAATMFVPDLDRDALREEITMYAGELEVPKRQPAAQDRWKQIEQLVAELSSRVSSEDALLQKRRSFSH